MKSKNLAAAATVALGLVMLAAVLLTYPASPIRAQTDQPPSQQPLGDGEGAILLEAADLAGIKVRGPGLKPNSPAQADPVSDGLRTFPKESLSLDGGPALLAPPSITADAILNGDFENGRDGSWLEDSTNGWPLVLSDTVLLTPPRSGSWAVWLGGAYTETSVIQQTVGVPTESANLGYWVWIASEDICEALPEDWYDWGGVVVYPGGSTTPVLKDAFQLCEGENTGQWVRRDADLSAYAGQVLPMQIFAFCDGSLNSNLFVDDVTLGTPQVGEYKVLLPAVLRGIGGGPQPYAPPCSARNDCEDYDTWGSAYGPLRPGEWYQAYPEDNNDYYFFTTDHTSSPTVRITGYDAVGQLLVRRENLSEIAKDYNTPPGADGIMTVPLPGLPQGKYYIQVFTSGDMQSNTLYSLKVEP